MPRSLRLSIQSSILGVIAVVAMGSTGCQIDVAGQTLPSPYYLYDDIQYFPAGPEMKLSNEAAALKAYAAEEVLDRTP